MLGKLSMHHLHAFIYFISVTVYCDFCVSVNADCVLSVDLLLIWSSLPVLCLTFVVHHGSKSTGMFDLCLGSLENFMLRAQNL